MGVRRRLSLGLYFPFCFYFISIGIYRFFVPIIITLLLGSSPLSFVQSDEDQILCVEGLYWAETFVF